MRWSGLSETFSEITDAASNHETDRPVMSNLIAHFNFLKQSSPVDYVAQTLSGKEMFSVLETRKKSFWWKPGQYQIMLKLRSPNKFRITHSGFHFDLTAVDIDRLKQNVTTLDSELRNIISSNLPDFEAQPVNWNWANVDMWTIRST